jgi:hypothetical protein
MITTGNDDDDDIGRLLARSCRSDGIGLRTVYEPPDGDPHPHPVPPLDFTSASRTQQASIPVGAGPPQHELGTGTAGDVDAGAPGSEV